MKDTRAIMGMPIEIEIIGDTVAEALDAAFDFLTRVDARFSVYKGSSEISRLNRGEIGPEDLSDDMIEVFSIAERAKEETDGYFDIRHPAGYLDPSGVVKGWAIFKTAELIRKHGYADYMVNAGGDIALGGRNAEGGEWSVGIRNPFALDEIIKVVYPRGKGIATSGSYIRGSHIYNPHVPADDLDEIVSTTVIGPDVLEADLVATAAFAMGSAGIAFIEELDGFEGYAISSAGIATMTSGFDEFT